MILELQLALFQAAQLKLIMQHFAAQQFDDRVQIAMLHFQLDYSSLYVFDWDHNYVSDAIACILRAKLNGV